MLDPNPKRKTGLLISPFLEFLSDTYLPHEILLHFLLTAASATYWHPLLVFAVAPAQSHYFAAYYSHFNLGHCN